MGIGARDRHGIGFGRESVASEQGVPRAASPLTATPGAPQADLPTPPRLGGWASAEAPGPVSQKRSTEQAVVWIRVFLRLEPELRLSDLAETLGLSDRQVGRALGVLIRRGKARVRMAPGGLRVIRVEPAPPEQPPMPHGLE
jgi:hypothetical protein